MPFVPAPQIVQAEIRATLDGQHIENRVMIDTLAAVTPAVVDAVAVLVNDWAQATYFDHLPQLVTLNAVVATDMSASDGAQVAIAPTGAFTGALVNAAMPNEVTFCVSLRSASRGRSARGRFYVLALQVPDVTANTLAAGRAATFVEDINTLIANVSAAGWRMVVVSYRHDGAPRVGGPVYYEITNGLAVDLTVDSQRRRRPGIGS